MSKNWLKLKIKPPLANLVFSNRLNTLSSLSLCVCVRERERERGYRKTEKDRSIDRERKKEKVGEEGRERQKERIGIGYIKTNRVRQKRERDKVGF